MLFTDRFMLRICNDETQNKKYPEASQPGIILINEFILSPVLPLMKQPNGKNKSKQDFEKKMEPVERINPKWMDLIEKIEQE